MSKFKITLTVDFDLAKNVRRLSHEERVADLRDGRKHRAATFKSGKEYTRKKKHKGKYE